MTCIVNLTLLAGVLAVTRALGDSYMKELVTGHPYTTETVIQEDDDFILLACDGVGNSPNILIANLLIYLFFCSSGMYVRIRKLSTLSKILMTPKKLARFWLITLFRNSPPIISVV